MKGSRVCAVAPAAYRQCRAVVAGLARSRLDSQQPLDCPDLLTSTSSVSRTGGGGLEALPRLLSEAIRISLGRTAQKLAHEKHGQGLSCAICL